MDDASCHAKRFSDCFSNVKVVLSTKNTTSRIQYIDMEIIRNSNAKYREKLLKCPISRISNNVTTIEIIQGVDIVKAISWINSSWEEILD